MENKNEPLLKDEEEKIFIGVDTSSSNNENTEVGKIGETPILMRKNVIDDNDQETDHVIPGVLISKREIAKEEKKELSQPIETSEEPTEDQPIISEIPITPIISENEVIETSEEVTSKEPKDEIKAEISPKPQDESPVAEDTPVVPEVTSTDSENAAIPTELEVTSVVAPVAPEKTEEPATVASDSQEEKTTPTAKKKRDTKKIVTIVVTLVLAFITVYLLVQTCIGFYYGFKYKNYVASQNQTTEPTP